MAIIAIDDDSEHFEAVKRIWRANSATLGFLPEGAFADYARRRHILVALDNAGRCVGYLLYRVARYRASIAHLCVDQLARGNGYAEALVRHLVATTKHLHAIDLRCRRDFPAYSLWPRLGFAARDHVVGRSADGYELTCFRLDHGHADLLSEPWDRDRLELALDSNIFLDIVDPPPVKNEESHSLLADWLQPFIRLAVTQELFNDIDRQKDPRIRKRRKLDADLFHVIRTTPDDYYAAEALLAPLFPGNQAKESDFRHLVRAKAAGVPVFVTRDEGLLSRGDDVYAHCGVSIVRPAELIGRIDELCREPEYQRQQMAGTNKVFKRRLSRCSDDILHRAQHGGERKSVVRDIVQRALAHPHTAAFCSIQDASAAPMALYVVEHGDDGFDRVPLLRVCDAVRSPTLLRAILTELVCDAAVARRSGLLITDCVEIGLAGACADLGFVRACGHWLKLPMPGLHKVLGLADQVAQTCAAAQIVSDEIATLAEWMRSETAHDASSATQIEHILWPAKLEEAELPSYIVPIRPDYAQELFDENLAKQTLWGADVELALNPESVYYRAARPAVLQDQGRILWYVSDKGKLEGRRHVRACSRIAESCVDKPKTLFKRFRRLGVYEWRDVFRTANKSVDNDIMAIRFDDTELFPRPLEWDSLHAILRRHGIKTTLQSPVELPREAFNEIYRYCTARDAAAVDPA